MVGLYAVLGFFAAPPLVRSVMRGQAEQLGCELHVGNIQTQPFTFQLDLEDLRLVCLESEPLVTLTELHGDLGLSSLWRWRWVLEAVRLKGPGLRVHRRSDGSMEILDLLERSLSERTSRASLPRFELQDFELTGGQIQLSDDSRRPAFRSTLSDLSFHIRGFTNVASAAASPHRLFVESERKERVRWSGRLDLEPLAATGSVAVDDLDLPKYYPYLHDLGPVDVDQGRADGRLAYRVAWTGNEVQLELQSGAFAVESLGASRQGRPWAKLDRLGVDDLHTTARLDLRSWDVALTFRRLELVGGWIAPTASRSVAPPTLADTSTRRETQLDGDLAPVSLAQLQTPPLHLHAVLTDGTLHDVELEARFRRETAAGLPWPLAAGSTIAVDGTLGIGERGRLTFEAAVDPIAPKAEVEVEVTDLDLAPYDASLGQARLRQGHATASGRLVVGPRIAFEGRSVLRDFAIVRGREPSPLVEWKEVRLTDVRATDRELDIGRIEVRGASARAVIEADRTLNLQQAFLVEVDASGTTETFPIFIERIDFDDTQLLLTDRSVRPTFRTTMEGLKGTILGLSPRAPGTLSLKGRINRHAPVVMTGSVHPFDLSRPSRVNIRLKNLGMSAFTPYSAKYGGWTIKKGKLDVDLKYNLVGTRVRGDNVVRIDQLTFGEKVDSPDKIGVPVRLGVALLKDRKGRIDLDLPVSGSLEDPEFSVSKLVWKAVFNTMEKAVLSPFAALGGLFESRGSQGVVRFVVGTSTTGPEAAQAIRRFEAELADRPSLVVEVQGEWHPEEDRRALAAQQLDALLEGFAQRADVPAPDLDLDLDRLPTPEDRVLVDAFRRAFAQLPPTTTSTVIEAYAAAANQPWAPPNDGPQPPPWSTLPPTELRQRWLRAIVVPEEALSTLARERARAVQDVLLAGGRVAPERVFVTNPDAGEAGVAIMLDAR
jgi:hypothetical protein